MAASTTTPHRLRPHATLASVALSTAAACTAAPEAATRPAQVQAPVIYGEDDRQDFFEASDPAFAELLRSATVAFVDPRYIDLSDPDDVVPDTVTLGEYKDLCPDQRYVDQPAMASCSGTLIDDDLVLTAAHCVDATVCADWYLVFGFYMVAAGELNRMTAADVYTCAEIVLAEYTTEDAADTWHDYAIIRLDRPVDARRAPAPIAMDASAVRVGGGLTVLGFGNGIPGKVHGGASVHQAIEAWGYFTGSTDTFSGNSGSGTYNDDHELVGVFTRGSDRDYLGRGEECSIVNTVAESEATQEYDYANKAVRDLCALGVASTRLCGGADPTPEATPEASPEAIPEAAPDGTPEVSEAAPPEVGDSGCGVTTGPVGGLAVLLLMRLALGASRRRLCTRGRPTTKD